MGRWLTDFLVVVRLRGRVRVRGPARQWSLRLPQPGSPDGWEVVRPGRQYYGMEDR